MFERGEMGAEPRLRLAEASVPSHAAWSSAVANLRLRTPAAPSRPNVPSSSSEKLSTPCPVMTTSPLSSVMVE